MDIKEAKKTIEDQKRFLANKFKVKEIGIFGSFARGEQTDQSDLDILVEFGEPVGFFTFIGLEEHLSCVLGRKVDLVTRKALKPNIGKNILKELVSV